MDQDNNPSPRPFFTFGPGMRVWLIIALMFAGAGIFSVLSNSSSMRWLSATPDSGYSVFIARLGLSVMQLFLFVMPAVVFANAFPPERFGFFRFGVKVKATHLLLGGLAMILIIPGLNWIGDLCYKMITDPQLKAIDDMSNQRDVWFDALPDVKSLLSVIVMSALVPAICEELFFRATLQQSMRQWVKNKHMAIGLTTIFFAVVHFSPSGFLPIYIAGLMLGYAFEFTGSIRINIFMHFMFNCAQLILSYAVQHSKPFADWKEPVWFDAASLILGLGIFVLMISHIRKSHRV